MYPTRSLYSKDTYYHMYIQHAQNKYDIVDMYKTQDNGYSARNSGPSPPNWADGLYDSAWADGGGYSKIIDLDSLLTLL